MNADALLPLVDRLAGKQILVVGDVILDEYLIGRAERLSREAPIPVLEFERRELIPGGAANPAVNVARLGSKAIQVGVIGADENGTLLTELLEARGINTQGLVSDPERPTTTKTRIMAQMGLRFPQQVARIDRIDRTLVNGQIEAAICERIRKLARHVDAIMVSDYLTGLMTPMIVRAILDSKVPTKIADAQGELRKYIGFDLVKCNADEASKFTQRTLVTNDDFVQAGKVISRDLGGNTAVVITRGTDGITLVGSYLTQPIHVPAPQIEDVYDTVGAGDTVLAIFTLAHTRFITLPQAAMLANLAAGIVIRKVGNYAPTVDELREAIRESHTVGT
ncbi:MAG: ribokinase [Anaerolineae bacterium]|nr:ribokinase [Anaerolineae bacterium]